MIELNNIQKIGDIISASVTIMSSPRESFDISLNVNDMTIAECSREADMYVMHAVYKLIKLVQEHGDDLPEHDEAVWL